MKLYAIGKKPIAEDSPAGEDIRNSEDFEALRSEIGKLSMPSNDGQSIDWEHVRELSTVILTDQSKDLFVAAYLAGALIELDGLQGLADGAGMLRDMTHHFWDDMHPPPKRMRGRINAYTWWKERALAYLKSFTPDSPQPGELLHSLQAAISELDAELGDKANDAPPLKDILGLVQRIPAQEPQPEQTPSAHEETQTPPEQTGHPQPDQQTASRQSSAADQAPGESGEADVPKPARPGLKQPALLPQEADEAGELCKHALEQLLTYREWVMNQDPLSPLAFRINRWAAWSRIQSLPPTEGTATRIPPPETEILRSVHQLLNQSKFRQVLQETESRVSQYLFWLDLSWASAQALQGLGEDGAQALDALETETTLFIRRFPGLGYLTFNDGTPFCSQHAWDWLHTLGRQSGSETEQRSDPVQKTLAQAQNKAAQNDSLGALSHLEDALNRETGMRERLRLQIGLLRILGQDTPSQVGTAYSREIVAALDRFSLDFWEPGLALEGLEAAYAILRNSSHEESFDQARALFARMSRISPSRAMHWTDPK